MSRMAGRRILITGGASGIGRASAALLAKQGARVAVMDRSANAAGDVATAIGGIAVPADVSNETSVEQAVAQAAAQLGGLDGVLNAAGIYHPELMMETSLEIWNRILAVNMTGIFLVSRAAVPHLQKEKDSAIVNIASGVGLQPTGAGGAAYAASKAGVIGLTRTMAAEFSPAIRVNAVCPGAVETPMTEGQIRDAGGAVYAAIANRYALRRPGQPDELANAILFLLSAEASFVTGIAMAVDGGRTFH